MMVFNWNNRECRGTELHAAVLAEDLEAVREVLDMDPGLLQRRFTYETKFEGKVQEGSGEAIHLAVTRSSVAVVRLLIDRGAALDSMVSRDHKPHYDVLHAAVFSEGRGGQSGVISLLLDAKAPATPNLAGEYPLHKAYQIGACAFDSIPRLRQDMEEQGLLEQVENAYGFEPKGPRSPLQAGIHFGKLTGEQLAQVASMTPVSLKIFLHDEPRSIPMFLSRMKSENTQLCPKELSQFVTMQDLCKCLRTCPESADVLLTGLLGEPDVDNPGWHPLPTRIWWGPRNRVEALRNLCNPSRVVYGTYQRTPSWEFCSVSFKAPDWHEDITGKFAAPIRDVDIQVCFLPEPVSAEFLAALLASENDEIFSNVVVRGTLNEVWWRGAWKVDLLQLLITTIGLFLLVLERANLEFDMFYADARELRWHSPFLMIHGVPQLPDVQEILHTNSRVAARFFLARGLVDMLQELVQLIGYWAIGRTSEFFSFYNAFDIFRALLAISFSWTKESPEVQVLLILICWFRLLEVSFSENLMRELLPITKLIKGLAPSGVVCCIAVCAFTHAKWVMVAKPMWPDVFYESFSLLITASLPEPSSSNSTLMFAYVSVTIFTVFFLNIFITVISENYSNEKQNAALSFQKKKCGLCLTFLIRAAVLPCQLASASTERLVVLLAAACGLLVLVLDCMHYPFVQSWSMMAFAVLHSISQLMCYQDNSDVWAKNRPDDTRPPRYLWLGVPLEKREKTKQDEIEESLAEAQRELQELQDALSERGLVLPAETQGGWSPVSTSLMPSSAGRRPAT